MDLVAQAGVDVSGWHVNPDGTAVKKPRANPKYCYEWSFGSESEALVVCVWHDSLRGEELESGPAVVYARNIRDRALALDRIAIDRTRPGPERGRARDQAKRARAFDGVLQTAFRRGLPVRMILNEGDQKKGAELGTDSASVKFRKLDTENWYMHRYDIATGDTLLVRGVPLTLQVTTDKPAVAPLPELLLQTVPSVSPAAVHGAEHLAEPFPAFVDQFSEPAAASQREVTITVRDRSAAVRGRVLQRAGGICELCCQPGFVTASGSIYLETHHVIPLSDEGPDHESNVVALCPDDHRKAHFGAARASIAETLLALVCRSN